MSKNILLYNSGGGLGDCIQIFDLVISLKNKFKDYNFYYLGAHENHFNSLLKNYNIKINTLDLKIKYFGFRCWHFFLVKYHLKLNNIKKFHLVIDLQSKIRNTLILNRIPCNYFYSQTFNYFFCSHKANYLSIKKNILVNLENIEKLINIKIPLIKYNISLIDEDYFIEAKKILPNNNYIGFSLTQGNVYRKKNWPINKFINVAKKIVEMNKIPVFLIKKNNTKLISKIKNEVKDAIFPEENTKYSDPAFVTALATRLSLTISINNGIMHMVSLAYNPMILLFGSGGPNETEKFAPKYSNVKILNSNKMYKTNDISKISEKDVLDLLKYINYKN